MPRFHDRKQAGIELAAELKNVLSGTSDESNDRPLVLALPRGGLPVAAEAAELLNAELDVLVVRKVGVPAHPELAMGALAMLAGSVETVRNETVLQQLPGAGDPGGEFDTVAAGERDELERRNELYRQGRPPVRVDGRTVIIIDDGLATGSTMKAALTAARRFKPHRLVAAVPVGARQTCIELEELADDVVGIFVTDALGSVGSAYRDFGQTSNEEVQVILSRH
ncbi:phosphoribosyltransferase [Arthrobacter castelli]|uniref:phosphoribosyltransferase n=1 Tax=Arthrobacter castelli TaxID=271431 RepID=UPI000408E0F0|nr:phosphoribosyltransferase family protein [Arthrobacter castelli]